jgi:hypothetical protein
MKNQAYVALQEREKYLIRGGRLYERKKNERVSYVGNSKIYTKGK